MRSNLGRSQWMEEKVGGGTGGEGGEEERGEGGEEETTEGGGEAEAWLGREAAGPEASEIIRRSTDIFIFTFLNQLL